MVEMTGQQVSTSVRKRARKISSSRHKETDIKTGKHSDYDKRIHSQTESLLSFSSGFQNYRGLLNNCIVLLILSSFRMALDNLLKYGILFDPVSGLVILLRDPYRWPSACLVLASNIFIQIMFLVEKCLAMGKLTEFVGSSIHCINLACVLVVPALVVFKYQPLPWYSSLALTWYTIVWLKFISYMSVNKWLREGSMSNPPTLCSQDGNADEDTAKNIPNGGPHDRTQTLVKYPDNLNQSDLYYFMVAPTLCYELNFPRTKRIRVRFLLRRVVECLFLIGVIMVIVQQWMVPTITNSFKPFKEMDYPRMVERIMKLAVPNHLMWLLFFYAFFHSFLNILAEILRFGDRTFYKDWWNSKTITQFWKTWNVPVHRWAHRHMYFPLLRRGYSQITSSCIVFLLSALFHEYLVSIPLQMFRVWAFFGMVSQVPLALFCSLLPKDSVYGNVVVWLSLIMGQPIAIMMYGHDYYVTHTQEPL